MELAVEQATQSRSRRSKWQFMGTSDAGAKEECHRVYCVSERTEGNPSLGNASSFQKSLVFCSRRTWEGGQYNRDEKSRLDDLCLAMELGADHIDVELQGEKKKKIKTENYWDWELANETKPIWSEGGRSITGVNISNEEQASISVAVPSVHETEGGSASLGPTYRDSFFHYKVNCRWLETCTILGKYSSSSEFLQLLS
ncbi:unnamed protein product [Lactuca saligna]|uniref:Uncharacterized protein n=1 Tax=Lactuca saligna TaxID=75948 RepID=A0AA35VQ05_LACSI|nr:unnamed protein product [Lactuca saligna]